MTQHPDDLTLRRQLRNALDDLDITRRATIEHDRAVLENFNEIRRSMAASLAVSRDHLVAALDAVDAALLDLAKYRLDVERKIENGDDLKD